MFLKRCMPRLCDQASTNQIRLLKKNNEKSICQKTKHSSRVSEGIYRQSYIRHGGRYLAFSLAVDKSTDNTDTVQLAIFIWGVKADVCLSRGALSCSFNAWDGDREGPVWWKRLLGRNNIGQKWGFLMEASSIKKLCVDCVYGDMPYHPQKLSRNVVLKLFKLRRDFFMRTKKQTEFVFACGQHLIWMELLSPFNSNLLIVLFN